jgi:hypothetical protein
LNQVLKFNGTKFVAAADATGVQSVSYEETIGNNTNTSFAINHNLGTKDLNVIVRENISPYDVVEVNWEATTINTVTVDFSAAPTTNSKRVAIKGPGTKEFYSTVIGDGSNSTIVVNHGLGSRNVVPVIRNVDSPFEVVEVLSYATSLNSVTLDFSAAPEAASLIASVYLLDINNSYFSTIGDGTNNEFTITHNLDTRDIGATCRSATSPYEFVSVRWEATTANTAKIIFSSPPTANSRKIGIYKSLGGSKFFNDEVTLDMLDDISITSPSNGQFLSWDGTNWVNSSAPGGAGISTINDLNDVTITSAANSQFLKYNGSAWVNEAIDLSTDTTGDYVSSLVAGTGINISNNSGEGATPTISLSASLDNVSDVVITSAQNGQLLEFDGTNWVNAVRPSSEPIGHENKADSVISFNEGTRTFSIAPASTSFTVWCAGKRFVKTTTETVQIPDISGLYYIYYNSSGVLSYRTTFFVWDTDAPTAYVYWNEVDNKAYFFADERHGITLDWATHEYLHRTRGAAIANGFGANNYILNGNGSSDTHAKIDIADGTFFDEDLQVDITHSATPTANTWEQVLQGNAEIPVFYRLNNHWKKDVATEFPLKQGTDRPQYNLNTAGTWSTEDAQNNHFGVSWIIATNNLNEPVIAILGQASYSNNGSAQAEFYTALNLDGFPIVEFRPLYKIIYECKNSYTNIPSARITDVIDLRSVISSDQGVGTTPVSDHGSMTGLADDDHTQYLTDARHDALDHSTAMSTVALDDIGNVTAPSPTSGDFLKWNGTAWVNDAINLGTDTVGDYISSLVAGAGITLSNNSGEGSTPTVEASAPMSLMQSSNNASYPLTISSANETGGGTGYSDILKLVNSKSGATNPNKHVRINSTGGLEIVNSAYNDTIFYLADNGNLSELGTVNGATLEDTGWISVSSFTNSFSAVAAVAYRKINNVVYLRGNVTGGTAGTGAFTLPVGYRPSLSTVIPVQQYGTGSINYVTVGTDGVVIPNASSAWLSSIIFPIG